MRSYKQTEQARAADEEEKPAAPKIVTAMIPCERGEPGSYYPPGAACWYRDVTVNCSTGEVTPSFDEMFFETHPESAEHVGWRRPCKS
jgi:hypothetical protein